MSAAPRLLAAGEPPPAPVDALHWSAGICGTTFGVRVGIRVDDPQLLTRIEAHLPYDWQHSDSPIVDHLYSLRGGGQIPGSRIRRFFLGYRGPCPFVRTLDEQEALHALEHALYGDIARAQTSYSFVHAGVVGWRGRAMVIPGATGTGKSQLVVALLRAGATFYSDDIAPIDHSGAVCPAPRAIGMREGTGRRAVAAESLGASTGSLPLPIALVVSTRYERGAVWQPRAGSTGEALLALMANTGTVRVAPAESMQRLARAVCAARFFEGPRGEAHVAARHLLSALEEMR